MSCSCPRTPRRNPAATSPEWACVRSTGTISPPSSRSTRRGLRVALGEIQGGARPDGDVGRSGCEPSDRGREGRGGGGRRRAARLPAGAVSLALLRPARGRLVGIYRKMHIPDDPAYYEKFYFAPGDLGFRAFDTRVGRIGTLVCWDQW